MDFLVPKLSATMETAKVLRWFKQVGDRIAMGEPLVELETDKATMEVESPLDATLEAVLVAEGGEQAVGAVLARLTTTGESEPTKFAQAEIAAPPARAEAPAVTAPRQSATAPAPRTLASPFAKRLARLNGIDLAGLAAANPLRRIRGRDVTASVDARRAQESSAAAAPGGFEPFSPMRCQIADAVTLSRRTIPSFVIDRWVDTAAIERARSALGGEIEQATGVRPTLTDFLLLAMVEAFAAHLRLLDRWHEEAGRVGRMRVASIDIGLVVAVPGGVMIPALRDLAGKSIRQIVEARQAAVQRARAGRLLEVDFAHASSSLSNIGKGGADRFEAIINAGQSSILAVGRQHERVIARAGVIAIAKGVNLAFSIDHRLIDGLQGAQFVETLAARIENGMSLAT